jgi:MFS family permease
VIKAGLIGAVAGFIYVMSLTLLSPFCTLCFTPLLGIGVGYLAGWFDTPQTSEVSMRRGGIAGGITGLAVMIGQILATLVNGILVTNSEELPKLLQEFGLSELILTESNQYWQATLTANSICSVFNLFVIAGLGAVGGMIWFQRRQSSLLTAAG